MAKLKLSWDDKKSAAQNARSVLPSIAEHFFQAGREVTNAEAPLKALHRFRLEVKRFRYSLELFRPCYGPGLKQRLEALKQLQDYLGAINDCETTVALLDDPAFRRHEEKKRLQESLAAQVAEKQAAFLHHWKETFDAPGQLESWKNYLTRFAASSPKKRK